MKCCYTLKDAECWAEFSGDNNPIHFDPEHARRMGSEHLLVHGMRAMLDMKRGLAECLLESTPHSTWLKFTARLRRSLCCGQLYDLSVEQNGARFSGGITSAEDQIEHYAARLVPGLPQAWSFEPAGNLHDITIANDLKARFPGRADEPAERWVFLDALLFRQLLSSTDLLSALRELNPFCEAATLPAFFASTAVVQTHHEVLFSAELFDVPLGTLLQADILAPQIVGSVETGFVMHIDIRGWIGSRPQICTSVTFRTLPQ
jgi:hypothetical protein